VEPERDSLETKEFPGKAYLADEPIETGGKVGIPVGRPHELPPLYPPPVDMEKNKEMAAKEMAAKEMARLKRKQAEELAIQKKVDEILAGEKLAREKLQTKNLAKEQFAKDRRGVEKRVKQEMVMREKLKAEEARPHFIVLNKTKSAIAFDVVFGKKWERTILLSARVRRKLRRLASPPPVTTELLAGKQLAVRERRLKELERVRDRARACA